MLSQGEQQRLGIARAILQKPDFLFLDEATARSTRPPRPTLYKLLKTRLAATTLVSIGHRTALAASMIAIWCWCARPRGTGCASRRRRPPDSQRRYHQRAGQASRRTRLCQSHAKDASSSAPTATGAMRKLHGMSCATTISGSIPAGG